MMRKMRVAIHNLSYCGGCEIALADLGGVLLDLLENKIELVYVPILMSAKDYDHVDVTLMTGAARTMDELDQLRRARERSRYLVSFGSCATFGGVPGLANLHGKDALLSAAFQQAPSLGEGGGTVPSAGVPPLADDIKPIDAYVKVDYALTGCPPLPAMIAQFLTGLLKTIPLGPLDEE